MHEKAPAGIPAGAVDPSITWGAEWGKGSRPE